MDGRHHLRIDDDPNCAVCGRVCSECVCPECPECGEQGNPFCYVKIVPDFDPIIPLRRFRVVDSFGLKGVPSKALLGAMEELNLDLQRLVPETHQRHVRWFIDGPKPNDYDPLVRAMHIGWRYIPKRVETNKE